MDTNAADTGLKTSEYRNLDVLRAVAVSCVFFAHLFQFLIKFGYVPVASPHLMWDTLLMQISHMGVLFFFVHTALVLMFSLDRTPASGKFVNFYIRRIFRIYPLSIACILIVLILKVPQVPDGTFVHWYGREIAANLLLIQNITHNADVITPLWTLPREFQMYLVLPFIYLLLKKIPSMVVVLILWYAFFAAVPLSQLLSCFPCFMGGVMAYQISRERVFRWPAYVWPLAIIGIDLLNLALSVTIFPDYRADYIPCMLLGFIIPNVIDLNESWITRASRTVAKYSYGVYLFHDPIIWISFVRLKSFPVPVRWSVLVLLMVIVPVVAYRVLEAPLIEVGRRLALRWTAAFDNYRMANARLFRPRLPQRAE